MNDGRLLQNSPLPQLSQAKKKTLCGGWYRKKMTSVAFNKDCLDAKGKSSYKGDVNKLMD